MKNNSVSVFGHIMNLLNIHTSAMAQALHVDASLVSKWKTGTRLLAKNSPYFDDAINYLVQNSDSDYKSLSLALSDYISPAQMNDISDSETLLRTVLSENTSSVLSMEQNIVFANKKTMPILCFGNNSGRREAIRRALSYAKIASGGEITIVDSEEFVWLLEDEEFLNYFMSNIRKLLKKGFIATFVMHYSPLKENFRKFFNHCAPILFHRNVKWYHSVYYDESVMNLSLLEVNNSVMILGTSVDSSQSTTMIFTDKNAIECHRRLIDRMIGHCVPIFYDFELFNLLSAINNITQFRKNDALYSFLPVPAFIAVRPSILQVVLKDNNVDDKTFEKVMSLNSDFRTVTKSYNINLGNSCNQFVQIFQLEKLIDRVKNRTFISNSLTKACGKEIIITPQHHTAVLRQLVDTLMKNDNVQIVMASEKDSQFLPMINCWVKKNSYMMQMDSKGFRVCDEITIINAAAIALERCVHRVPPDRKDKNSVADFS